MAITAILAGGGTYFVAKDRMQKANFGSSINLIKADDDGGWCELAKGQTFQGNSGGWFCAIRMREFEGAE